MKSSQEKVQGLETKLVLTAVKKHVSQRDPIVQFDYWVPMEGTCTNVCMISCVLTDYYPHRKGLVERYGKLVMILFLFQAISKC